MPLFGRDQREAATQRLSTLMDSLYRVSESDLQGFLAEHHGVELIGARHEFLQVPDKLGAAHALELFNCPTREDLRGTVVAQTGPVAIVAQERKCALLYTTNAQSFSFAFAGAPEAVMQWSRRLKENPIGYASAFLYVLNRFRASQALEKRDSQEKHFFDAVYDDFRSNEPPAVALARIARATSFQEAVCCVYGVYSQTLLPIASTYSTDAVVETRGIRKEYLSFWREILDTERMYVLKDLSETAGKACNCASHLRAGEQQVAFVKIGHERERDGEVPRGILCLYRTERGEVNTRQEVLLKYAARELAAWIDEIDESLENDILKGAIRVTEQVCGVGMTRSIDRTLFDAVLQNMGLVISESLQRKYGLRDSAGAVECAFVDNVEVFGNVPEEHALEVRDTAKSITPAGFFHQDTRTPSQTVFYSRGCDDMVFMVRSRGPELTILRPHVYAWLHALLRLAYRLVQLERRRLSFIQRTIHEIRHPMQGLITMGSEIRRLAEQTTVSRKDIAHYAEDMETSTLRLKVMLTTLGNISGVEKIVPCFRPTFLHRDVLRPMRRLMGAHARKRGLSIGEPPILDTIGYIDTDPDLLSLVFYNILDNAIKYSARDSVISVSFSEGDEYYVDVTSRGPALSREDATKVFDLEFRGSNVRNKDAGLGLGLYIANVIAERLKCSILLLDGGDRSGTITFRLCIPKSLAVE